MAKEIKTTPSPDFYGLLIDKDRSKALHIVLQAAMLYSPILNATLGRLNLQQCFDIMVEEIGVKEHLLGWCSDPNCTRKQGPEINNSEQKL